MSIQTVLLDSFLKEEQFTITNLLLWFEVLIYKSRSNEPDHLGNTFNWIPNYLKTQHKKRKHIQ